MPQSLPSHTVSSPLEEEICQEEADETKNRSDLNRYTLSPLWSDCSGCSNFRGARLRIGRDGGLALTQAIF